MCIIVVKPEKVVISADSFRTMWKANSDGAGFMYATGDKVVISKGFMKFNEFWDAYQEAGPLRKMVVHFRIKTHGDVTPENTHPFWVVKNKLALAHNGIIRSLTNLTSAKESDSAVFARMLAENYKNPASILKNSFIRATLESYIGYSKVVFMNSDGETIILNEHMGTWHKNVWYSNDSFKGPQVLMNSKVPSAGKGKGQKSKPSDFQKELDAIFERFGKDAVTDGASFKPNAPLTGPKLIQAPEHFAPTAKPATPPKKDGKPTTVFHDDEIFKEDHELAAAMQSWKN